MFVVFIGATTSLNAQPPAGRQLGQVEMYKAQKEKLKEDLKLTDVQADSVATIQMEYMPKLRGMRGLEQEARAAKIKEINDAFKARLKSALGDDKLVDKVIEYQETQRKERMERMRSGE